MHHKLHNARGDIALFRGGVPLGLDFEAAGGSIVHYCLSMLQGYRVAVNMTWALFHGKMQKHSKECPSLSLADM